MTTTAIETELTQLEKKFWDSMKTKDVSIAAAMTADQCIVAGPSGVAAVNPKMMGQMMEGAKWTLKSYNFEDVHFRPLGKDSAIIAYRVKEKLEVEGKAVELEAFDTSVWQRDGSKWVCVLHTESLAGDPFGRDREPAK